MWVGQIQVGAGKEPIGVIFDTGSDKLVVQSIDCSNCRGSLYSHDLSGTPLGDTTYKINYGSASLLVA